VGIPVSLKAAPLHMVGLLEMLPERLWGKRLCSRLVIARLLCINDDQASMKAGR
jgi:hypothetical protein